MHTDDSSPTVEGSAFDNVDGGKGFVKGNEQLHPKHSSEAPLLYRLELLECNLAVAADILSAESNSSSDSNSRQLWGPRIGGKKKDWHLKTITGVLKEAEEKGTLIERVAALEQKFFMISMDLKKLLSSSSRTFDTVSTVSDASYKNALDLPVVEEKQASPFQGQEPTLPQNDTFPSNGPLWDDASATQNSAWGVKEMKKQKQKKNKKKTTRNQDEDAESSLRSLSREQLSSSRAKFHLDAERASRERKKYLRHLLHKLLHPMS